MFTSPDPLAIVGALTIGLLANTHCLAMCGGIGAALGAASGGGNTLAMALAYNLGRILCYALLGAGAGGAIASLNAVLPVLGPLLRSAAGLLVIAMGLYIGGWWFGLARLEKLGDRLWRRVQPATRRLLPPKNPGAALLLGGLWGLLPCGLIYSTLSWAATSGDPWRGAILMGSFGLGTLPVLLLAALGGQSALRLLRRPLLRKAAAVLLIAFGALTIAAPLRHASGHHGAGQTHHSDKIA